MSIRGGIRVPDEAAYGGIKAEVSINPYSNVSKISIILDLQLKNIPCMADRVCMRNPEQDGESMDVQKPYLKVFLPTNIIIHQHFQYV